MSTAEEKEVLDFLRVKAHDLGGPSTPKIDTKDDSEAGLDAMYARLTASTPSVASTPKTVTNKAFSGPSPDKFVFETPTKDSKADAASQKQEQMDPKAVKKTISGPSSAKFVFEVPAVKDASVEKQGDIGVKVVQQAVSGSGVGTPSKDVKDGDGTQKQENSHPTKAENADKKKTADLGNHSVSKKDIEKEYLQKAWEYITSLPSAGDTPAHLVSTVARKLRQTITPNTQDVGNLQSAVGEAVATYLSGLDNVGENKIEPKKAAQLLTDNDGDFLKFCSTLIDEQLISIDILDDVAGLCKAIIKVLPDEKKLKSYDPMDGMKSWPAQVKRENITGCRTVLLKGVGDLKSINQIQALIWGGPVESIHMPEPGKDFAMVKFMTAAGCRKYFDATENGIQLPTDKTKKIIFVERQPGPNSVNDVLQNCIDGNVSRCVRAVGADDDWSDMALRKLAEGTSKKKREVDTIKRGKTARGVSIRNFSDVNIRACFVLTICVSTITSSSASPASTIVSTSSGS
jgi:protein-S-isoprenylcysteine O-methyltransferase